MWAERNDSAAEAVARNAAEGSLSDGCKTVTPQYPRRIDRIRDVDKRITSTLDWQWSNRVESFRSASAGTPVMRLPRFRLTVRRLMVVVAVVAVFLGCWEAWRASQLAGRASVYRSQANAFRSMASGFRQQASDPRTDAKIAADFARDAAELEEVARIYERAAARPRQTVKFVPPEPK